MTAVWIQVLLVSWLAGWFTLCVELALRVSQVRYRPPISYWLCMFTGLVLWWPLFVGQMFRAARNPE